MPKKRSKRPKSRKRPEKQETTYVVVSYWPLVHLDRPEIYEDNQVERLTHFLSDYPPVDIRGCLWVGDSEEEGIRPVLLLERAQEVRDHLVHWSEKKPADWFRVFVDLIPGDPENKYVVMIYPNVQRSVERFKVACVMYHETIPDPDAKYHVLFQYLKFVSLPNPQTFPTIRHRLGSDVTIGFLDINEIDPEHPEATDFSKVAYIDNIPRDNTVTPTVKEFLKELSEPPDVLDNP